MKRALSCLAWLAVSLPVWAQQAPVAPAAPVVKLSELPKAFRKAPPYIQNQVCAELMASMYRLSLDLYRASGQEKVKETAALVGTRSMVFVKANADLAEAEKAQAKRIAEAIEQQPSNAAPAMKPFFFCEQRAQRWLAEGVVTQTDYAVTEQEVRQAIAASLRTSTPTR